MSRFLGRVHVLYGSATGTAQDVAERIWQDGKRRRFQMRICAMDDIMLNDDLVTALGETNVLIFVCSTTGQGEEPVNMKKFWRWLLQKKLSPNSIDKCDVAVLGLGDSSYTKFNFVAKKLFRRLSQLGGHCLLPLGLADDQHDLGIAGAVDPWVTDLWRSLDAKYPLPAGIKAIPDDVVLPPRFSFNWLDDKPSVGNDCLERAAGLELDQNKVHNGIPDSIRPFSAHLLSNDRVTPEDHFQDTRLVCLDIEGSGIIYSPGDVAYVMPHNWETVCDEFIEMMNLEPARSFMLKSEDSDCPVPHRLRGPLTVDFVVRYHFDLLGVPRRSFFKLLSCFAGSDLEKEKLEEICCPEGQEELYSYCNRPRRSLLEALADFPCSSKNVPFEYLFELIPPIRPRAFSIASNQTLHRSQLQLLVAVVQYKTRLARPRLGLCSNWLAGLKQGDTVPLWTRRGSIRFPLDNVPCLMIGPGTGVAPFRSFVHGRALAGIGGNVLYFGCRNKTKDYYFEKEWNRLKEDHLLDIHCAFSRDQPEKVYVQHVIAENGSAVWDSVENDTCYIFLAGSANQMPKDVITTLKEIFVDFGKMTEADASDYLANMEKRARFQTETWS